MQNALLIHCAIYCCFCTLQLHIASPDDYPREQHSSICSDHIEQPILARLSKAPVPCRPVLRTSPVLSIFAFLLL